MSDPSKLYTICNEWKTAKIKLIDNPLMIKELIESVNERIDND